LLSLPATWSGITSHSRGVSASSRYRKGKLQAVNQQCAIHRFMTTPAAVLCSSKQVGFGQVDAFVPASIQHRLDHVETEPDHLIQLERGRHREFLAVHHHLDQRRSFVAKYSSSWKGIHICLTLRRHTAISCPGLTVLLGGDRHGTRPQVLIAHCSLPRRAPDLGPVATVDHACRRAGPTWEDYTLAGRWPITIPRGAGGRRPADRRSQVGEALSGSAS
jgi:hypothetical protein